MSPRDPSPQGPNGVLNCSLNNSLNSSLSRASSFTMLDPASGVPCSDGTPRTLAASLTSRASMHHGGGYQAFLPSGLGRYGHSAIRQVIFVLSQAALWTFWMQMQWSKRFCSLKPMFYKMSQSKFRSQAGVQAFVQSREIVLDLSIFKN